MNCSSCGTQVAADDRNCPNCGRTAKGKPTSLGGVQDPSASSSSSELSPSFAKAPGPPAGSQPKVAASKRRVKSKKKAPKKKSDPEMSLDTPIEETEFESGSECAVAIAQIRGLIRDCPGCLEEGLSVYTDAKGKPVGVGFESAVGSIDLLARDNAGGLVVVLIAPPFAQDSSAVGKELVSMALERVGWIRKHLAEPQQEVRAIVLLERVPEDISYSASAVASTVAFMTYRSEITFRNVDV
jgi:hypothetical protein